MEYPTRSQMTSAQDDIILKKLANQYRIECLWAIFKAGFGHVASCMSCMEILTCLYHGVIDEKPVMKYDPKKPDWDKRDYFILSKSHAAPALYAILANLGFFPKEELLSLCHTFASLQARPHRSVPGIDAAIGASGHGLSVANGIALALKMDKEQGRVYALLGDGELQKGEVWEAAMAASHYKLDNLIVFIDNNKFQGGGFTHMIMNVEPIRSKFESFGFHAIPVINGHNPAEILEAIQKAWRIKFKPIVVICDTVKGKGIPFAEKNPLYHGTSLSKEEMDVAIPYLTRDVL